MGDLLTREQVAALGVPCRPELLIGGLRIEDLQVRASGHGRGEKTIVFALDLGAGGRDEHGTLIRVDPAAVVAACGGCDVILRRGDDVLARSEAGTLELREHEGRLRCWARLAATTAVEDLAVALDRRDVDTAGVELVAGEDRFTRDEDAITRTVLGVRSVSAVVLGAGIDAGRASAPALAAARRRARAALVEHALKRAFARQPFEGATPRLGGLRRTHVRPMGRPGPRWYPGTIWPRVGDLAVHGQHLGFGPDLRGDLTDTGRNPGVHPDRADRQPVQQQAKRDPRTFIVLSPSNALREGG